jgi:abortive infection bacteriophage resistance protein
LFRLLKYPDRRAIADTVGLPREHVLASWLTALNYVRNICAHNSRLWNRQLTVKPASPGERQLPDRLRHLATVPNTRAYFAVAITAHLVGSLHADDKWGLRAADILGSFPASSGRSAHHEFGLPPTWRSETLWN